MRNTATRGAVVRSMVGALRWSPVPVLAYGIASAGPASPRAQWRRRVKHALSQVEPRGAELEEADLSALPEPLAAYIRRSGAVGKPRVTRLHATIHGRIRGGPDAPWMPFTGEQVNTFGPRPQRFFFIRASRSGVPVSVLHLYDRGTATMRAKVLSLVTVVRSSGPEMDRAETVTVFNDLVLLAPAAIVDAPVRWTRLDGNSVRGVFAVGGQSVTADLTFDAEHNLVDFVSQDRLRASADGKTFVQQGWSTPVAASAEIAGRRFVSRGAGRWHAPQPEGTFTYIDFHVDAIHYNVSTLP